MTTARAIFLGSKAFGLAMLQALRDAEPALAWEVIHPDDRADGRSAVSAFEAYCAGRQIPMTISRQAKDAYAAIAGARPDIVFVCGWYFLIPAGLLAGGPRFFGIHNSLLPRYRGGAPLVWAIIAGETIVGSSLFGLTPGMDDGPLYLQVSGGLGADDTIADALAMLEARFLAALPEVWPAIASGAEPGRTQDHAAATYCGQRLPDDGEIDWNQDAAAVHNFVRAQTRPYPGAFTRSPAGRLSIWKTRPFAAPYSGTPGQVLERRPDQVLVACGRGTAVAVLDASGPDGETDLMRLLPALSARLGRDHREGSSNDL